MTEFPATTGRFSIKHVHLPVPPADTLEMITLLYPNPRATVIYFAGNSLVHCPGTLSTAGGKAFIDGMANLGVSVVLVNQRGYGRSTGRPSLARGQQDALAVVDYWFAQREAHGLPLAVHGQSLGTVYATHVATYRQVAGVILESPPTTVRDVVNRAIPWYAKPLVRVKVAESLGTVDHRVLVSAIAVPALVVVGGEDKVTPVEMAREIYARIPTPARLQLVARGSHGDLVEHDAFWTAINAFLADISLGGNRRPGTD